LYHLIHRVGTGERQRLTPLAEPLNYIDS